MTRSLALEFIFGKWPRNQNIQVFLIYLVSEHKAIRMAGVTSFFASIEVLVFKKVLRKLKVYGDFEV